MVNQNLNKAESYYMAMYNKNFDEMASYIHPHVLFIGPLATFNGKESVVEAAKNFSMFFKNFIIRERFTFGDKVMLVLDFDCPDPIGTLRGASFLSFDDGLISCIELFYDARPFEKKKDEFLLKIELSLTSCSYLIIILSVTAVFYYYPAKPHYRQVYSFSIDEI